MYNKGKCACVIDEMVAMLYRDACVCYMGKCGCFI